MLTGQTGQQEAVEPVDHGAHPILQLALALDILPQARPAHAFRHGGEKRLDRRHQLGVDMPQARQPLRRRTLRRLPRVASKAPHR